MRSSFAKSAAMLLLVVLLSVTINAVSAQNLPLRYATLELFTNTPCPICASQNSGLFTRLAGYTDEYHLISFYPGSPYSSCVFYQDNIAENQARKAYYPGIFGSPNVVINGTQIKSSSGVTTAILDAVTGGESWLEVHVEESSGTSRTVNVTLEDHVGGSLTTGRFFAVIVERLINYTAPNGETNHHNVFRRFLTDVNGQDVDMTSGLVNLTYDYEVDGEWQADEIYVIAWLADPATKEIYNSGTRFDQDFTSVKDQYSDNDIKVFPNPVNNRIYATLSDFTESAVNVRLMSTSGVEAMVLNSIPVHAGSIEIAVDAIPPGIYLLLLNGKEKRFRKTVVIE